MALHMFSTLCTVIGAAVLANGAWQLASFVWLYTRPSSLHKYLHGGTVDAAKGGGQRPAWALVTGSSDGIGKCLALELAARGFNVVLHGRSAEKLAGVAAALKEAHPSCETRTIVYDASQCARDGGDSLQRAFVAAVQDLNLTVLINNAGGGVRSGAFGTLDSYGKDAIVDNTSLNALFPAALSAALIPQLLGSGGPALIINVSSLAAGLPLVSFYGAAKAYLNTLTHSVAREMDMEGRAIEVMVHRIGRVRGTSIDDGADGEPGVFSPPAATAARAILARVGCGRKEVVPYWGHALQAVATMGFMPEELLDKVLINVMRGERARDAAKRKKQ